MICLCLGKLLFQEQHALSLAWISTAAGLVSLLMPLNPPLGSAKTPTLPFQMLSLVYFLIPQTLLNHSYLGLPILMGNSKKIAFQGIIDKVHCRIDGWRAKTISQAGRLVLIKSVAAALPSYAMSSFLLPISWCKELDRLFKNLWWGFPNKKSRNLSLKAWDSICFPKVLGGLGIRKMKDERS